MDLAAKLALYGNSAKPEAKQSPVTPEKQGRLNPAGDDVRYGDANANAATDGVIEEKPAKEIPNDQDPGVTRPGQSLTFDNISLEPLGDGLYFRQIRFHSLELGGASLQKLLGQPMQYLDDLLPSGPRLSQAPGMVHRDEVLFLDTETTGLSRGPGNFPFLYGLAWFEGSSLVFEQYFLDGPGAEDRFHTRLSELLTSFGAICTYNGKSFDIPVIRNRFVLLGERFRAPPIHLDLYHFWKSMFGGYSRKKGPGKNDVLSSSASASASASASSSSSSVGGQRRASATPKSVEKRSFRQMDMERDVLGFVREDDLPGAQVPQVYFDYRKYARKERMAQVLHHNELDLQGLALLFLRAVAVVDERRNQEDLFRSGIARMFWRHGKAEEAKRILEELHSYGNYEESLLYSDRRLLALILKKRGQYESAFQIHRRLFEKYHCMHSCLEVARFQEKKERDIRAALGTVKSGLAFLEFRGADTESRIFKDLQKRRKRLQASVSEES
ncbi:MAG: ribonuclease H-like domain-containing protein [Leptospiraceae bacterium]|nr:ribonuclease H-like domain-containing protein [Leptospiraceae bacterium]